MISVKVVNQVIYDHDLNKFNPIDGIDPRKFAEVYGDSFISGTAPPTHFLVELHH